MTSPLTQFQDAFIDALYAEPGGAAASALAAQPAFAVYRNTVFKACVDALAANYPSVGVLVGTEWMRSAALEYARSRAPASVSLLNYGEDFPAFLAGLVAAADLPYLADVARLDRAWNHAHGAPDHAVLQAAELGALAPHALAEVRLRPLPGATWAWFPDMPVYTIWSASRARRTPAPDIAWQAEGILLLPRDQVVRWQPLDAGACAFLDACAGGGTLAQCCEQALLADSSLDIGTTLAGLINAGVFCGIPE
ncbi:MAG: DNA-binding domain-containing protein [Pseudomonadota bacterium]